jgi:FdhD protein
MPGMPTDSQQPEPSPSIVADAASVRRHVVRSRDGAIEGTEDWVASEVPVALQFNGVSHAVMLATPMDLEDFALGFSLSESIIGSATELEAIEIRECLEGFVVEMRIPQERAAALAARHRHLIGSSSCGLCGMQHLEDVVRHPPHVANVPDVDADILHRALSALDEAQPLNRRTGATHAAAWSGIDGCLLEVREDVGRHNALDKLIGAMARQEFEPSKGFLVLTSRASHEMVQKAATAGIGVVAAISAPTSMAIHLAETTGMTLVGFARDAGHVVYTHAERIGTGEP